MTDNVRIKDESVKRRLKYWKERQIGPDGNGTYLSVDTDEEYKQE